MADERFNARPTNSRDTLPWTELFRTFRVALDPRKLLLAAAGMLQCLVHAEHRQTGRAANLG